MNSQRTFYRTILQVEILSETPYNETSLSQVAEDITEGAQVGRVTITTANEELDGKTAASELTKVGSEPAFFLLDKHGNDIPDEEEEDYEDDDDHKVRKMKD